MIFEELLKSIWLTNFNTNSYRILSSFMIEIDFKIIVIYISKFLSLVLIQAFIVL